jgi:hypothetical protein
MDLISVICKVERRRQASSPMRVWDKQAFRREFVSGRKFLSSVQPIFGPRPAALANLVAAVPLLGNDTFQPLAANCTDHVSGRDLEVVSNPESGRLEPQNGFHDFMALDKRQAREIAIVKNEKIEDEVMNARRFCSVVLQEIEVRTPRFVQCHNFTVNNRVVGKISQSVEDQRILSVEGIPPPGKKIELTG